MPLPALLAVAGEQLPLGRAGLGVMMLVRPRLLPGALGVDSATSARMAWLVQMLGAREVALGLGSVVAARSGDLPACRTWLGGSLLSDAADAVAVAGAVGRGQLKRLPGVALVAVAVAAVAVQAAELARR